MNYSISYYTRYYQKIKYEIKSENVQEAIEKIALSIENNLTYLSHFHFKDVCTFDFLGDGITEAANRSLKDGKISVATN